MEILIIIVLLVVAAETSYLTFGTVRKNARMALSPVFVDTSVLIDGRIVAIAESGFISRPLYIPRSVVGELQFLADNADSEKRSRARHGLDIITQLQDIAAVKASIFNDGVRAADGVDNRLLELAKKHSGAICTIDYNLNKVAVVEGLEVLNVNELAKSLRMAYLPGERALIELTQKGNDTHQGVGHLSDGTMVVVEHAYKQIGTKVEIEFIRSLQTAAGKMMFAKLVKPTETPAPVKTRQAKVEKRANKATGRRTTVQASPVANDVAATVAEPIQPVARPQRAKQPSAPRQSQRQSQSQPQQRTPRSGNSRRRKSPEDSMVELANQ